MRALFLALALLGLAPGPAGASEPVVPFSSYFFHWDNHWYVWLPRDPVYEAVEVMSAKRTEFQNLVRQNS